MGRSAKRAGQRGFTIIEVLMAVLIMAVGLVALLGMQVVVLEGGSGARDTSMATSIGESVVEQLQVESVPWSSLNQVPNSVDQPLLDKVFSNRGVFVPLYDGYPVTPTMIPRKSGHSRYASGGGGQVTNDGDVNFDAGVLGLASVNARYCVDVIGNFLDPNQPDLLTGQVRVSWPNGRNRQAWSVAEERCITENTFSATLYPGGFSLGPSGDWNFVHIPFAIRRNNY